MVIKMCYYIMEFEKQLIVAWKMKYVNKEPECVNIYIKYNNSYECYLQIGDIVMSVEVYSGSSSIMILY